MFSREEKENPENERFLNLTGAKHPEYIQSSYGSIIKRQAIQLESQQTVGIGIFFQRGLRNGQQHTKVAQSSVKGKSERQWNAT